MSEFPLEENILTVIRDRQRNVENGVFPKTVRLMLPVSIAEQTVRRYMVRLWLAGRLYRYGGVGARRGYRTPRDSEIIIENQVIDLLKKNPWGLVSDKVAEMLGVQAGFVEEWLPQMEARGLLLWNRGAWRLPSELQKLSFVTVGHFGYRVA